jgi:hypothetical protein
MLKQNILPLKTGIELGMQYSNPAYDCVFNPSGEIPSLVPVSQNKLN